MAYCLPSLDRLGLFQFVGCYCADALYCGDCVVHIRENNPKRCCPYLCSKPRGQVGISFDLLQVHFAPYPVDLVKEVEFRKTREYRNQQRDARVERRRIKKAAPDTRFKLTHKMIEKIIADDDWHQARQEAAERASIVKRIKNDPHKQRCKDGIKRLNAAVAKLKWETEMKDITHNVLIGRDIKDGQMKVYSCYFYTSHNCPERFSSIAECTKHLHTHKEKLYDIYLISPCNLNFISNQPSHKRN